MCSKVCGILAIVFGAIGLLIYPAIFGVVGLALGVLSICLGDSKTLGIIGTAISAIDILWFVIVLLGLIG